MRQPLREVVLARPANCGVPPPHPPLETSPSSVRALRGSRTGYRLLGEDKSSQVCQVDLLFLSLQLGERRSVRFVLSLPALVLYISSGLSWLPSPSLSPPLQAGTSLSKQPRPVELFRLFCGSSAWLLQSSLHLFTKLSFCLLQSRLIRFAHSGRHLKRYQIAPEQDGRSAGQRSLPGPARRLRTVCPSIIPCIAFCILYDTTTTPEHAVQWKRD